MSDDPEPTPAPEPIVADSERCQAAADELIRSVTDGCTTMAQRYRNVAHTYALVKARVGQIRDATRKARLVAHHEAEIAKVKGS